LQISPNGINGAFTNVTLKSCHSLRKCLTHSAALGIALPARKTTHAFANLHDLLLVANNTVGIFQCLLPGGVKIVRVFLALLSSNKIFYPLHWTRSVERVHSNKVFNNTPLKFFKVALHTGSFNLKHASGISFLIQLKSFFVIQRQF